MKRSFASLLVAIFALCTVPSLSVADAAAPPIQYAEDHELTPYSFENFQDKLSIQLDEKWKQFVFFWPEDNHVEVDEHVLTSLPVVATNQQEVSSFYTWLSTTSSPFSLLSVSVLDEAIISALSFTYRFRSISRSHVPAEPPPGVPTFP